MGFFAWLDKRRRAKRLLHALILLGAVVSSIPGCAPSSTTTSSPVVQQEQKEANFLQRQIERSATHSAHLDEVRLTAVRERLERLKHLLAQEVAENMLSAMEHGAKAVGESSDTASLVGTIIVQGGYAARTVYLKHKILLIEEIESIIATLYDFEIADMRAQEIVDVRQFDEMQRYITDLAMKLSSPTWDDLLRKERRNADLAAAIRTLRRAMADEIRFDSAQMRALLANKGSELQQERWRRFEVTVGRMLAPFT